MQAARRFRLSIGAGLLALPLGLAAVVADPAGAASARGVGVTVAGAPPTIDITPNAGPTAVTVPAHGVVDATFSVPTGMYLYAALTGGASDCRATATLLGPAGEASLPPQCAGAPSTFDRVDSAVGGRHRLRFANPSGTPVTVSAGVSTGRDTVGELGGTGGTGGTVPWRIDRPGQRQVSRFDAVVGRRPTLVVTGSTFPVNGGVVRLVDPDGTTRQTLSFATGARWLEFAPVTRAGSWAFVVDPPGSVTGRASARLDQVADLVRSLTPGVAKTVSVQVRGQNVLLRFPASAGDRPVVTLAGSSVVAAEVTLLRPDGSAFAVAGVGPGDTTLDWSASPLDASGRWTLLLDPQEQDRGSVTTTVALR